MKRAPLCKFFAKGNCRNGANCPFSHATVERFGIEAQNSGYQLYYDEPENSDFSGGQWQQQRGSYANKYEDEYLEQGTSFYNSRQGSHQRDLGDPNLYVYLGPERKTSGQRNFAADKSKYKWVAPSLRPEASKGNDGTLKPVGQEQRESGGLLNKQPLTGSSTPGSSSRNGVSGDLTAESQQGSIEILSCCYTSLKDVSKPDLEQFEASEFRYVPLVPPPKEMCFD